MRRGKRHDYQVNQVLALLIEDAIPLEDRVMVPLDSLNACLHEVVVVICQQGCGLIGGQSEGLAKRDNYELKSSGCLAESSIRF